MGTEDAIVAETNTVRRQVVETLGRYVELSATMREFESTFGAKVLHHAQRLFEAVEERRRLEAEYAEIRRRLERGEYPDGEALSRDIRAALAPDRDAEPGGGADPVRLVEATDDGLDELAREQIVREFKRIVLPNVHTDTSDTPYSIFEVAYNAYRERDYTLMAAFIVRYRGEVSRSGDDGRALARDQLRDRLAGYRGVFDRIEERYLELMVDVTEEELRDPEGARERMRSQEAQFRQAIVDEAERLQDVRARLESLAERGVT